MIWSRINVVIGTTTISIHNSWKPLKKSHLKIYIEMRHFRWLFKTLCHFFLNELSKGKNNKWREKRYRSTTLSPSTSVKPVMMAASTLCWLHYTILYQGKRESKKLFAQSTLACFQKMHSCSLPSIQIPLGGETMLFLLCKKFYFPLPVLMHNFLLLIW